MKTHRPGHARLVPALAAAHLRHDWILTLCLVIALTAVIAPLLVLLGLKHGTIETLRERLVEDPVYRELRPTQTQPYSEDWFAQVAAWPGVAFLTPTILPLSSVVQVVRADETTSLFDLIPTAAGDPLLLENGVPVPGEDEVVLTAEAARLSGVAIGDRLGVRVSRTRGGRSENVQAELKVVGVLPIGAGTLTRLYAPLAFVLDVESYKEGYAAARRGWPGDTPDPYPSFDGVVLLLDEPLSPIVRTGAIIQTGFARIGEITRDQAETLLGLPIPQRLHAYDLSTPNTPITQSNIRAIQTKLRGREPLLLPYVRDLELIGADGRPWRPAGLSVDAEQAARLDLPPVPWGGFQARRERAEELTSVLWPVDAESNADADTRQEADDSLAVTSAGRAELSFMLHPQGPSPLSEPLVPIELLGILRTAQDRAVTYVASSGRFEMQRAGYRGFRLYAAGLDDVPRLYRRLREQGLELDAAIEAIERIQVLDGGATRLFWLIALLGLCGGTAVLVASLYAAVDRLRTELGIIRLLGLSRAHVAFFPIVEGLMIAALSLAVSFGAYGALAAVINRSFANELAPDERFCALPASLIAPIVLTTLLLACLAALVAAWRSTNIDPSEVVRAD
ncbi:FtsX-like permease family protein [Allochromatium vinosum]|uniref:FtsX-like permease family protein n=1 Tax=Allochromatium vinosum TaxID=1049 RepID=UPI001907749A|nr:FtsX-like permease family protein [Allochromatium vinosum]MBK1655435.1 ABC transporter permease [Allochromatium vinosum]